MINYTYFFFQSFFFFLLNFFPSTFSPVIFPLLEISTGVHHDRQRQQHVFLGAVCMCWTLTELPSGIS